MGIEGIDNFKIDQDQTPYKGDEPVKEDGPKLIEQEPVLPLDPHYVKGQQDAEEQKKDDLAVARDLHNRVTAGEDPTDVKADLGL